MSGFRKFEDEGDAEANGDNTTSFFKSPPAEAVDDHTEFRNKNLDSNFKRDPIRTWLKMMFPHFELFSITTIYSLLIIVFYVLEMLLYMKNSWS